jgi:hypothetical protein
MEFNKDRLASNGTTETSPKVKACMRGVLEMGLDHGTTASFTVKGIAYGVEFESCWFGTSMEVLFYSYCVEPSSSHLQFAA